MTREEMMMTKKRAIEEQNYSFFLSVILSCFLHNQNLKRRGVGSPSSVKGGVDYFQF